MALIPFDRWKLALLKSAGSAGPAVLLMGEGILELFYRDGCEPTMASLLRYAEIGLLKDADAYSARPVFTPLSPARPPQR